MEEDFLRSERRGWRRGRKGEENILYSFMYPFGFKFQVEETKTLFTKKTVYTHHKVQFHIIPVHYITIHNTTCIQHTTKKNV